MISVVVPVRDGRPWLEEQLEALAAQECPEPWEVVVADNGSTDGSDELARGWAAGHARFRVIDASSRPGAPAARNAGVQAAQGELLAFCDADDVVAAGWLASCRTGLENADVVAGVFDFWSLNGLPSSPPQPAAFRQMGFLPAGLSANLAVRRRPFDEVGGFDEDLLQGEDIDLCWRLQLRGHRFAIAPDAVVAKRSRADFVAAFHQGVAYGRSGVILYRRYRPGGARRDVPLALKSWAHLLMTVPTLRRPEARTGWARAAGMRLGRLRWSIKLRAFFP